MALYQLAIISQEPKYNFVKFCAKFQTENLNVIYKMKFLITTMQINIM